jgi:hypothetical protein
VNGTPGLGWTWNPPGGMVMPCEVAYDRPDLIFALGGKRCLESR